MQPKLSLPRIVTVNLACPSFDPSREYKRTRIPTFEIPKHPLFLLGQLLLRPQQLSHSTKRLPLVAAAVHEGSSVVWSWWLLGRYPVVIDGCLGHLRCLEPVPMMLCLLLLLGAGGDAVGAGSMCKFLIITASTVDFLKNRLISVFAVSGWQS